MGRLLLKRRLGLNLNFRTTRHLFSHPQQLPDLPHEAYHIFIYLRISILDYNTLERCLLEEVNLRVDLDLHSTAHLCNLVQQLHFEVVSHWNIVGVGFNQVYELLVTDPVEFAHVLVSRLLRHEGDGGWLHWMVVLHGSG